MVLTKEILKTINAKNIEWYKSKGYECKLRDNVLVRVEDLSIGAKDNISYQCDLCEKISTRHFYKFSSKDNLHKKTYCVKCANELMKRNKGAEFVAKNGEKLCSKCKRNLPANSDYFYLKNDTRDGFVQRCKECIGKNFTDYLTNIPEDGYVFCKKCKRELPHDYLHFPADKNCKTGLRFVCRECTDSLSGFLSEDYIPQEKWTDAELDLLKRLYKDYTTEELVNNFFQNRTGKSLISQADVHGFAFKTEETKLRSRIQQGEKVSKKLKGRIISEEHRAKTSKGLRKYYETHRGSRYGIKLTEEQIKALSERNTRVGKWKGNKNPRHINPLNGSLNGKVVLLHFTLNCEVTQKIGSKIL